MTTPTLPRFTTSSYRVSFAHDAANADACAQWWRSYGTQAGLDVSVLFEPDGLRSVVFFESAAPLLRDLAADGYPPYGAVAADSPLIAALRNLEALGARDVKIFDQRQGRPWGMEGIPL